MDIPLKVVVKLSSPEKRDADADADAALEEEEEEDEDQQELVRAADRKFRFSRVFRGETDPREIYAETVAGGATEAVLEGFDFSIVSYGERGSGKSFALYGGGSGGGEGIVLCFVRDLFCQLGGHPERMYSVGVAWTEITSDGDVIDVLGAAMMQCFTIEEIYGLLSLGLHNRNPENHSILSLILEQQWTALNGLNQHRQSTVSFCDLTGTEREVVEGASRLKDSGLRKLEDIVHKRTEDYNESILTAFLKDSFGGRAQTLMLLCVKELDGENGIRNLEFGDKAQEMVNHVVMNTFSDNNVPAVALNEDLSAGLPQPNYDGLYFASQQWSKLLKNAESLFNKIFSTCELTPQERSQIEEWLYLKAECDDCFSSTDISINAGNPPARVCLGPIEEIDEGGDDTLQSCSGKINTTSEQCNSDNESDSDICTHLTDMTDRIQGYMRSFQVKTNNLINEKYKDFFQAHPKMIDDMNEEIRQQEKRKQMAPVHNPARRKSIYDADSVSSNDMSLMSQLRSNSTTSLAPGPVISSKRLDTLNNNLRITVAGVDSLHAQIEEIRRTISLKQKYITDLIENSETRSVAKSRFNKKKRNLEDEYEKAKKQLTKAVVNGQADKKEINHLKGKTSQLEQRLKDLDSIRYIAGESGHKKKKLQQSIKESQKQLELLQKMLKKELDKKETIEKEIEVVKKEKTSKISAIQEISEGKSKIKNMNERISHIEHVLKEKSSNLKKYVNKKSEKDSLRQEIINLRRTRDHLLDQRCTLDRKIREDKMPSFDEERKLVECDEAIEAIDAAIEMKNELICGRKSIDTDESLQREKGEQMLMARLNKLSTDEMRTLLYKYFQKVVDLKESSKKLEVQFISLERERDTWEWQEKILTNAIRQTRLEKERSIIALQKQHETKLNLMLRHFAADTSASIGSSIPENALHPYSPTGGDLVFSPSSSRYHHHHQQLSALDSDSEPTPHSKHLAAAAHFKTSANVAATAAASSVQPLVAAAAEKQDRSKNKLFSKLQVLTRYHNDKRKIFQSDIPQQNLKQLQISSRPSLTKVTREKNKIIIQSDGGK